MSLDHTRPTALEGRLAVFLQDLKKAPVSGKPNLTTRELITALYRAMAQTTTSPQTEPVTREQGNLHGH